MTEKEVLARTDIHVFRYTVNVGGIKIIEFGAIFLLVLAAIIYPMTHFDPPAWRIASICLVAVSICLGFFSQRWRLYVRRAFVAYDKEFLFVANDPKAVDCIPWGKLDVENTGLSKPRAGADLKMHIDGKEIHLRLFTVLVCIPQFETILHTMLTHIKDNAKAGK